MGLMTLPASGLVYLDASPVIDTVESHPVYGPLLQPLWQAAQAGTIEVVTSELTLMEALVEPLKRGDKALVQTFEQALSGTDLRLLPLTLPILREAARLRASTRLKTPDAIHAATSQSAGCILFITNDLGFRGIASLALVILDDLLTP